MSKRLSNKPESKGSPKKKPKLLQLAAAAFSVAAANACSAADLRPENFQLEPLQKDADLRQYFPPTMPKSIVYSGLDYWPSTIKRWFTPLNENKAPLRLEVNLASGMHTLTLASKGGENSSVDAKDIYLTSSVDYQAWQLTLGELPIQKRLTDKEVGGTQYRVYYAAEQVDFDPNTNQYILYFNDDNQLVYIEFTMRRFMKSYRGTVHYADFRSAGKLSLPHTVTITSRPGDKDFDHRFTWESINIQP